MKLLHAADLHIDSPLRGLSTIAGVPAEAVRSATRRAFTNLIDLALAEEVAILLLAGDIFDGDWQDHQTGIFFASQLSRLDVAGVPVFIARGNHDAENQISLRVALPKNVKVFGSGQVETVDLLDLGIAVHGWSFNVRAVSENVARRFPNPVPGRVNIGVVHTNLDGQAGHDNYAPCASIDLVNRGYHYWALGHVHTRQHQELRGTHIVYPGNLQGRHARETATEGKGATLIHVDQGSVTCVEHRALDVVRWLACTVNAEGITSRDQLVHTIVDVVRAAGQPIPIPIIARVTVTGQTPLHREWAAHSTEIAAGVRAQLDPNAVSVEKIINETDAPHDADTLEAMDAAIAQIASAVEYVHADADAKARLLAEITEGLDRILGPLGTRALAQAEVNVPTKLFAPDLDSLLAAAQERLTAHLRPQSPNGRS